jgi:hypothetical protein
MKAYIFFSVHERLFRRVAAELRAEHGVPEFCGFVWGEDQARYLSRHDIAYDPLVVFTRDVVPRAKSQRARIDELRARERRSGVSIHRMIWAERHLLADRSYGQILDLVSAIFDAVDNAFDAAKPDFIFSEDVSCLTSYIHWVVAQERNIPFWCIGDARIPYRLSVYRDLQEWRHTRQVFERLTAEGIDAQTRKVAESYIEAFRNRPVRPAGMDVRAKLPVAQKNDWVRLADLVRRYRIDPDNPTLDPPLGAVGQRVHRLARARWSQRRNYFTRPRQGEPYVLYPIHFQPEASTLVLAPMYLDQLALIESIAKSLPVGHWLYVKEHLTNRGRRPLEFYRRIAAVPGVRLLGPDEDTWQLIQRSAAVAVITGTMGWEGVLFRKPVITFGQVFFNGTGQVYEARREPPDRWHAVFDRAIYHHHHDEDALVRYVAAMHETSYPGFMRNPGTFPEVLEPDNVCKLATALMAEVALDRTVWASSSGQPDARSARVDRASYVMGGGTVG